MSERIAVFIDADNISLRDLGVILDEIKNYGNIVINRAYGDWSKLESFKEKSIEYGIELIQANSISGKNSSDIKLCVDAMNILHTLKEISIFYIITCDSDFIHLVPYIKCLSKEVRCIGYECTNKGLQNIVNMFTKIEVLRKTNNNNKCNIDTANKTKNENKKYRESNIEMLQTINRDIEQMIINNETGEINIGRINEILQRRYQFDYREYNSQSMLQFLMKYHKDYIKNTRSGIIYLNKIN